MRALAFADPVFESQAAFRAILRAMASPGEILACGAALAPPVGLAPAAAAALLALADFETPLWVAPEFPNREDIFDYLKFHTGAPVAAEPNKAAFALAEASAAPLDLARLASGTPDYPDRSTTLVLQVSTLGRGSPLNLSGPGANGEAKLVLSPLPENFVAALAANRAAFPLGVDLVLAAGASLAALPRSTRVAGGL